jgi:hypothetical protein
VRGYILIGVRKKWEIGKKKLYKKQKENGKIEVERVP